MEEKNCKKCGNKFKQQKGLINYCSLKCRNSRTWSDKDKKKKSIAAKKSEKVKLANKNAKDRMLKLHKEVFPKIFAKRKKMRKQEIMTADFSTLKFERLRERIIIEQDYKCNRCKNKNWLNNPIPLELEHKDGNNKNNLSENLEMLCPNCHALTKTWRGRNSRKGKRKNKINDKTLLEILINNNWNIYQSLLDVGLSPKGGNYKRCYRLKHEYDEVVGAVGLEPTMEDLVTSFA